MTEHTDGLIGEDVDALDGRPDLDTPDSVEPSQTETAKLSARERAQQRVALARASLRDTTVRARNSAAFPTRRTVEPTGDSVDASGDDGDAATITLADRAQAYRAHIISAAVAVIGVLVVVLRRRAAAHQADDFVDLGEWHLHAEPIDD
jgi:hypothetical protein